MKNIKYLSSILLLILLVAGCSDNGHSLELRSYTAEVKFGEIKYIPVTDWEGDRSKIIAIPEDEDIASIDIVDYKEAGGKADIPYLRILGVGNGETSVTVEDEMGNKVVLKVKATYAYAAFTADKTVRLLLDDEKYKINLREGDSQGGEYSFGREGDVVTFKWINKESGKSAVLTYTETSKDDLFSFDEHTDAVLTLIKPDAENEADRYVVIRLPYLKVITMQEKNENPITGIVPGKVWILFRVPAREGQERGTLGYCVGSF